MSLSQPGSHASSKTPSAFIPVHERLDLSMSQDVLKIRKTTYTIAHLNSLEVLGNSAFRDARCVNLLYNAFRLRWKVAGKILHTFADHERDLVEFLSLEIDNKRIIGDLFTEQAIYHLLERRETDALVVMASMIRDIYEVQWGQWQDKAMHDSHHQGYHAMVIAQAQAMANQVSNNVLAFKDNAAPELRRWAEETASKHLMAIITPGHLPSRPVTRPASSVPDGGRDSTHDLMFSSHGNKHSFHIDERKSNNSDDRTKPGPSDNRNQASVAARPTLSTKRKTSPSTSHPDNAPTAKKHKTNPESSFGSRSYETYRPAYHQAPNPNNGRGRPAYHGTNARHSHHLNHQDHRQQSRDTPSFQQLRQAKLRELQAKIDAFDNLNNPDVTGS